LHGRLRRRGPRLHRLGLGRRDVGPGFGFLGRPDQADAEHGELRRQRDHLRLQQQPEDEGMQGQHEGQPAAGEAGRPAGTKSQSRQDGVF
jgi:hypothetical protein